MSILKLTFIGHSTTLIDMDGARLITDPILRRYLGPLIRFGPPIADEWLESIDAVLLSHVHHDHLDFKSMKMLGYRTPLIVPRGAAKPLARRGHTDITEIEVGDTVRVGGLDVEVVPAVHSGSRPPFGPKTEPVGFVVRGHRSVYFPGDTEDFPEMASLAPDLDVALLPVWGWGPTLGKGHMDPEGAAEAARLMRPRVAVPIHWGTFSPVGFRYMKPGYLTEPPIEFARLSAEVAPDTDVHILVAGETLHMDDESATVQRLED